MNKNCRISTERITELLIYARGRIPWVQANLILTDTDDKNQIRLWQQHLKARGVWVSEPVPMFPFPEVRAMSRPLANHRMTKRGSVRTGITCRSSPTKASATSVTSVLSRSKSWRMRRKLAASSLVQRPTSELFSGDHFVIRIAIVGSGYVGLVAAACFAEIGHRVVCIDKDEAKVAALQRGETIIHEEFLPELIARHQGERLQFTTSLAEGLKDSTVVFIAVGTPPARAVRRMSLFSIRCAAKLHVQSTISSWWW